MSIDAHCIEDVYRRPLLLSASKYIFLHVISKLGET